MEDLIALDREIGNLEAAYAREKADEERNGSRYSRIPGLLAEIDNLKRRRAIAAEPRDIAFAIAERIAAENVGHDRIAIARIAREVLAGSRVHLNPASVLPPVDCPLMIKVDGKLVQAVRTGFISSRANPMGYRLADGREIEGRFPWTYP